MAEKAKLRHVIAEIKNPRKQCFSTSCNKFFGGVAEVIAEELSLNILKVADHHFSPHGYTAVYLLSESHMSFHTWPENKLIAFDLFTCGEVDPQQLQEILMGELGTRTSPIKVSLIDRSES